MLHLSWQAYTSLFLGAFGLVITLWDRLHRSREQSAVEGLIEMQNHSADESTITVGSVSAPREVKLRYEEDVVVTTGDGRVFHIVTAKRKRRGRTDLKSADSARIPTPVHSQNE